MDKVVLGKTGLHATVAGLGCGGHSVIGMKKFGMDHAINMVRTAFEEGVNFFDTAVIYGTEGAVGQGLDGISRDRFILSTKYPYNQGDDWRENGAANLTASLENSLRELKTDYIDIYHLHGVKPEDYIDARDVMLPAMLKARDQGKIRFLGITELFVTDTAHKMLNMALPENLFDVVMVGYNILNPSAAKVILPKAAELDTGVLCMFAVRTALSNPRQLRIDLDRIITAGQAGEGLLAASEDALDFLLSASPTIMDAAYRFCRHKLPIHVVLTGTGSADHLRDNLRSINSPPLPQHVLDRLETLFGRVDCISGQ